MSISLSLPHVELNESDAVSLSMPTLLAYQHVARALKSSRRTSAAALQSGTYLSQHKGRGMEFDEVRHYQPGDDIRSIDWRVTARTGKAHTKLFREERERPVLLCVDFSATMQFGTALQLKSVLAGHCASLLGWRAKQRGDRVGGLLFNSLAHTERKPSNSNASLLYLLEQCCQLQQHQPLQLNQDNHTFDDVLMRLKHLARPGSVVYLISDFSQLQPRHQGLLQIIARRCELHAFVCRDPLEHQQFDTPFRLWVTDGVNTEEREFGHSNQRGPTPINMLQGTGCRVHELTSAQPLAEQLAQLNV